MVNHVIISLKVLEAIRQVERMDENDKDNRSRANRLLLL